VLSPLIKSYDDHDVTDRPGGRSLKTALEHAVAPPVTPHQEDIINVLALCVDTTLRGRMSPRAALRLASKQIDSLLASEAPGDES